MADYTPSTALVRKSTDMKLMPPPAKRMKRPPKVLDEDTYTNALSDIIARDFFPGLVQTESQREYLDALDSKDPEWIASAGRRLTEVMTPGRRTSTPAMKPAVPETTNPMTKEYNDKLSLDAFQAKYTSEDNASFNELLDNQNQKRRDEYGWLWRGNKIANARVVAEQKMLKNKEQKMLEYKDDRPAMPDTWKLNPRNTLMFTPPNLDDEVIEQADSNPATNSQSRAPPKAITHANTRLAPPQEIVPPIPASPSYSTIRDAIAGRPRLESESGVSMGGSTPRVNGYSFVDDAPSPTPEQLGAPPMTWGTVEDLLPSVDIAPNPFKIATTPRRELTLHRMVDKVAKTKRAAARQTQPGTPSTSGSSRTQRMGSMTPAAQRLWSRIGTKREDTALTGKPEGMRYRWTPTPTAKQNDATPLMKRTDATPIVTREKA